MIAVSIFDVTDEMLPTRQPYEPVTADDQIWLQILAFEPPAPKQRTARAGNHRDSYGVADSEHSERKLCSRCGIQFSACPHAGFGICVDCVDVELEVVA